MNTNHSELAVITKSKDLCSYVMTITQRSPKQVRFTFVSRMQNLSLDVIEYLYRANDTFITKGDTAAWRQRLEFQHKAMTSLKLLSYFSLLALENKCIIQKQFEQISRQSVECMNLLGGWINSDKRRLQS